MQERNKKIKKIAERMERMRGDELCMVNYLILQITQKTPCKIGQTPRQTF
jgi:hypothetical protein